MTTATFSICIPAYKSVTYLGRLLNSVFEQTFTDFEIVITDDSPDATVSDWLRANYNDPRIAYFKNPVALGTPENWNQSIRYAKGKWIKLMHDDDWFATPNALQSFYDATVANGKAGFYFCAYRNVDLDNPHIYKDFWLNRRHWKQIEKYPPNIYSQNIIGAPSVVLVKRGIAQTYDNRLKWLVDIDFYIRAMACTTTCYIPEILVNVGQSKLQVTSYTHNNPEVEIPEGLILLSKLKGSPFNHILYYDAWWRLLRNLKIRESSRLLALAGKEEAPMELVKMLGDMRRIPPALLSKGVFSKALMVASYLKCRIFN